MAYEVTATADAPSERLVVSVGGVSLVYGEALDQDREAEGVVIVAEQDSPYEGDADLASELALLSERVPEVAAAVQVTYVPDPEPEAAPAEEVVDVIPAPEADTVVPAPDTTPEVVRDEVLPDPFVPDFKDGAGQG